VCKVILCASLVGEKLGFMLEGRIRNGCEVCGRFFDRVKMGLLRDEWQWRRGG
jgi:RimJ/RimL family protein N-acetyltransferase